MTEKRDHRPIEPVRRHRRVKIEAENFEASLREARSEPQLGEDEPENTWEGIAYGQPAEDQHRFPAVSPDQTLSVALLGVREIGSLTPVHEQYLDGGRAYRRLVVAHEAEDHEGYEAAKKDLHAIIESLAAPAKPKRLRRDETPDGLWKPNVLMKGVDGDPTEITVSSEREFSRGGKPSGETVRRARAKETFPRLRAEWLPWVESRLLDAEGGRLDEGLAGEDPGLVQLFSTAFQALGRKGTPHAVVCEMLAIHLQETVGGGRLTQNGVEKILSDARRAAGAPGSPGPSGMRLK